METALAILAWPTGSNVELQRMNDALIHQVNMVTAQLRPTDRFIGSSIQLLVVLDAL